MGVAQKEGAAAAGRSAWRREMTESKVDMGLLDDFSTATADFDRTARFTGVLKLWNENKSPQPEDNVLSFESLLRDTGS